MYFQKKTHVNRSHLFQQCVGQRPVRKKIHLNGSHLFQQCAGQPTFRKTPTSTGTIFLNSVRFHIQSGNKTPSVCAGSLDLHNVGESESSVTQGNSTSRGWQKLWAPTSSPQEPSAEPRVRLPFSHPQQLLQKSQLLPVMFQELGVGGAQTNLACKQVCNMEPQLPGTEELLEWERIMLAVNRKSFAHRKKKTLPASLNVFPLSPL